MLLALAWTFEGEHAGAGLWQIASAGDVNADGFRDIALGSPGFDNVWTYGRVYVFLGSASGVETAPSWIWTPPDAHSLAGGSLGSADVNDDGFNDLLVGGADAHVFLGSATGLGSAPDWSGPDLGGVAADDAVIARAGDVNGDGFDDVILGALRPQS